MTVGLRIVSFIVLGLMLGVIFFFIADVPNPIDSITTIIFTTLLTLSFTTLIIEHYFAKPTDVMSVSISIILVLLPVKQDLDRLGEWFYVIFFYALFWLIISLISIFLFDPNLPDSNKRNVYAKICKDFATKFGNGKVQYYGLFILTLLFYVDSKSNYFIALFAYSGFILTNPWKLLINIPRLVKKLNDNALGQVFGVQAKNTFLIKLYNKRPSIKIFDFVEFISATDENKKVLKGLIIDNYLLNQEQWIKVLVSDEIQNIFNVGTGNIINKPNVVYKIDTPENNEYLDKFVGIVSEESNIVLLRFIYNSKKKISEGTLLEVQISEEKILYQVIQGTTKIELLEHKNETGFITGEAIQLGKWDLATGKFIKYGWVPNINSPVYLAQNTQDVLLSANELLIGNIPNSNYPVILDKGTAISHHTAILGITGSGKSVFTRNLVREFLSDPVVKVICIDFTLEYKGKFPDLNPNNIIDDATSGELFKCVDFIINEQEKFPNNQDKPTMKIHSETIINTFRDSISNFLKGDERLSIFELPDVSNASGVFEYTRAFFKQLFHIAKVEKCHGRKVCIVLEEAHTVIPEWNFMGLNEKNSQSLVNSIGQIALQGRKYGIGFIVVAQRTANVSKTILTQCNTIISFQSFDKTSGDFLTNYFGAYIVDSIPNLRFKQAIIGGKALKSNTPLIFEVPYIDEPPA